MTAATNRVPSPLHPGISRTRGELKFSLRETFQTPLSQSARFTDVLLILNTPAFLWRPTRHLTSIHLTLDLKITNLYLSIVINLVN